MAVWRRPGRSWEGNSVVYIGEVGRDGVDWTQDTDKWRALVNTVTNLLVPSKTRCFLSAEKLLVEFNMELVI
jgi:hypothetical protein